MLSSARTGSVRRSLALRLPALSIHAVGLILIPLAVMTLAAVQAVDFDYWWQRRTGQWIVENVAVPRTEFYSFSAAGNAYTDHEWLSQIVIYFVDSAFGYLALFLVFMALGIAAWWLSYRLLRRSGAGQFAGLALSLAPAVFGAKYWRVRPLMFTVFFTSLFLSEMFAARRGERRRLWHLIPLMTLWANLHGGYVIGLVMLALLAGSQWWDRDETLGPSWRHVSLVLALSFLATAINPYTYHVWLYPLSYLANNNPNLQLIDEWKSPNFHEARNLPLAFLLVTSMIAGVNGRKFDAWRTSLIIVFGAMALQSMRHQPLFAFVWAAAVGSTLVERWPNVWGERVRAQAAARGVAALNWGILLATGSALAVVVAVSPGHLTFGAAPTDGANPRPVAGADYIMAHDRGANVFNEYSWGGYLIARLYPQNMIFIDGRADPYGPVLHTYDAIVRAEDWREALGRYQPDVALLPPYLPITRALRDDGWRVAYEDKTQVVLERPGYAPVR